MTYRSDGSQNCTAPRHQNPLDDRSRWGALDCLVLAKPAQGKRHAAFGNEFTTEHLERANPAGETKVSLVRQTHWLPRLGFDAADAEPLSLLEE
jgi:hypothetical protein